MNKIIYLPLILVVGSVLLVCADDATTEAPKSGRLAKTLNGVNKVADKIPKVVHDLTGNIEVRVDRLVKSQQENPNIIVSAIKGAGRYIKNVSAGVGQFASTVGRGVADLGRTTTSETGHLIKSSLRRIAGVKPCPDCEAIKDAALAAAADSNHKAPEAPAEADAQAPAELTNNTPESAVQEAAPAAKEAAPAAKEAAPVAKEAAPVAKEAGPAKEAAPAKESEAASAE